MGTTAQKLQKILDTKAALKIAINEKGGTINDDTPFDEYPIQVSGIPSSPSFTDPNVTFSYVAASNKLEIEYSGSFDSSFDNKIFIYKHNVTLKYGESASDSNLTTVTIDVYVMLSMISSTKNVKIAVMPRPNASTLYAYPTGTQNNFFSTATGFNSYLGMQKYSYYVRNATLNSSELINVIDLNE